MKRLDEKLGSVHPEVDTYHDIILMDLAFSSWFFSSFVTINKSMNHACIYNNIVILCFMHFPTISADSAGLRPLQATGR